MMVGINPVSDALGRVNKLEVMSLEELGRPRVDVVVNCSGVFRDLFVNQMNLLDRAIKMAAEQDEPEEMNFVRKHACVQVLAVPLHPFSYTALLHPFSSVPTGWLKQPLSGLPLPDLLDHRLLSDALHRCLAYGMILHGWGDK